jgi:hypothetical protein
VESGGSSIYSLKVNLFLSSISADLIFPTVIQILTEYSFRRFAAYHKRIVLRFNVSISVERLNCSMAVVTLR